jgi:hypothetical protein
LKVLMGYQRLPFTCAIGVFNRSEELEMAP